MGKGGKVNCRRNFKGSARPKDIGSDDSDEDYVVEFEKNASDDESEDLVDSVDEYASEESFGSYVEEDEEEEEYRKIVVRSKSRKGSRANARNGKIKGKISRKRKRVSYEEEEEVEEEKEEEDEDDEDFVNDDEDDDEEFTPDEDDDFLDEDEELTVRKRTYNMKLGKRTKSKKGLKRPRTKRRKSRVSTKPLEKKGRNKRRLKKKVRLERDDDEYEGDFIDDSSVSRERSRKNSGLKRRNYAVSSDSEFVLSGSSDCDYTISEEEREQVREANKLFGEVKANLRSSSSVKKIQEDGDVCQQGKSLAKKGKEKLKEVKSEMGKQVCGICLSEEDKRRFRGSLDCCSHYFCFTCIMEWSKVESRCPLCKQRFKTITKNGRAAAAVGVDLRNVVIEVPMRDQVYQPSEEEIRSYIDPYENVICTECHEGGDDGLMLLCDLCDSPAHTYCVGLGRQVPEGNWYCDGCRPVALGSSSQSQDPLPDQRASSHMFNRPSPVRANGGGIDPVVESSPHLAFIQGFGNLPSPRFPAGDIQAASPVSGTGAPTLSVRRQIHRHIQNIRMHNLASRIDSMSASNFHSDLLNPHIDRCRETGVQNSRIQEMPSQNIFLDERLQTNDHPSSSLRNDDPLSLRTGQSRVQVVHDPSITASESSINLTLWPELSGTNSISSHEQFHQCNRAGIASGVNLSPHRVRDESHFFLVKEQLQSMVKSHLNSLSQDIQLGNDTFKEITRSSTHTILAACGLEHKRSEVQLVPPPSVCYHGDRVIAGQTSIMKGFCSSCFDSFARDVVKRIMDTRLPGWLSLGL